MVVYIFLLISGNHLKVSGLDPKNDLVPTVISDDGKKRVIRYSLRNGNNPGQSVQGNVTKKTIEYVNHSGFKPVERVIRTENPITIKAERSKSQYVINEPVERMTRTVIPNTYQKPHQSQKVISVSKSNYIPLNPNKKSICLRRSNDNSGWWEQHEQIL